MPSCSDWDTVALKLCESGEWNHIDIGRPFDGIDNGRYKVRSIQYLSNLAICDQRKSRLTGAL